MFLKRIICSCFTFYAFHVLVFINDMCVFLRIGHGNFFIIINTIAAMNAIIAIIATATTNNIVNQLKPSKIPKQIDQQSQSWLA